MAPGLPAPAVGHPLHDQQALQRAGGITPAVLGRVMKKPVVCLGKEVEKQVHVKNNKY